MRFKLFMSIAAFFLFNTVFFVFANAPDEINSTKEITQSKKVDTVELSIYDDLVELEEKVQVISDPVNNRRMKSALPFLMLFTLTIAGSGIFLIKKKEKMMRNFSMWALFNPVKTKILLTGAQILLLGSALFIGKDMYELGVALPKEAMYLSLGAGVIGAILYPFKRKSTYTRNFKLRKTFDLIIPLAGLIFLSTASNQYQINPSKSYTPLHIINTSAFGSFLGMDKSAKPEVQDFSYSTKKTSKENKKKTSVGRIIIAVLISLIALSFLLAATCALGCIAFGLVGGGTIGWVVGIPVWAIGTVFSIILTIRLFKAIIEKRDVEETGA